MAEEPTSGDSPLMRRAGEIFFAVRELGLADREEAIRRECAGDKALEDLVRLLLAGDDAPLPVEALADEVRAAHEAATGEGPGATPTLPAAREVGGTRIGNYRLLERIGEGGFGVVFMAEQERPVRRRVALKIIKLGMDTRQVVARFDAERQALAMMDHPNIARVFDAGATETGRPYFVMELVRGVPITEYCDSRRLGVRARLDLFAQVCDALQHAHQKGVIHRDIKPTNVLVTEMGETAVPKVIDFGIAKATNASLTEKTIFTEMRQMIGTPEYMSPEQASVSALDIDTRSDVYSLGVLLYELLAGSTPFDSTRLRSAAYGEIQRIIREEDPPKPSHKLTTLQTRSTVAAARRIEPGTLGSLLEGELDWVVMKCLEKDRARRYDSAGALMRDVRRFIAGEAVQAVPPSIAYRLRKFVRKNKGPVVAGSLLALALGGGLVGTSMGYWKAESQRRVAVVQKGRADENAAEANRLAAAEAAARRDVLRQQYEACLHAGAALLYSHQSFLALEQLGHCDPALRGWEWHWLMANTDVSVATFRDSDQPVRGVAVSPDSTRFATYGDDRVIRVRAAPSGEIVCEIRGQSVSFDGVSFSGDGARILISSTDGVARVFDSGTGQRLLELKGHTQAVKISVFSPNGSTILTGSDDHTARVWDARTGAERLVFRGHQGWVNGGGFSPDGSRVVTSSDDGTAIVWDPATGKTIIALSGHAGFAGQGAFSPDGSRIVTRDAASVIRVWDTTSGDPIATLRGHTDYVVSAAFVRAGSQVLSTSNDGTARLWDAQTGRVEHVFRSHSGVVLSASVNREGTRIVTASQDRTAIIWDAATGEKVADLVGHGSRVLDAKFVDDDRMIVTTSFDGTTRLWDAQGTQFAATRVEEPGVLVYQGAFHPSGERFVVGLSRGAAVVYSSDTGAKLLELGGQDAPVWDAAYSPDGGRIVTAAGSIARVWDATTGELLFAVKHDEHLTCARFSPDGRRFATASKDALAKIWDADTGKLLVTVRGHAAAVSTVDWSPDGRRLLTASWDRTARVWNAETGEQFLMLSGHTGFVISAVFSPDGSRILTSSRDLTAKVWDASSGALVSTPVHETEILNWAGYHPDGSRIAVSAEDGSTKIWDLDRGSMLVEIRCDRGYVLTSAFSADGRRLLTTSGDNAARVWHLAPYRDRYPAIRAVRESQRDR